MKKKLMMAIVFLLCLGTLSGCGDSKVLRESDAPAESKVTDVPTETKEAAAIDYEKVVLSESLDEGIVVENYSPYSGIYLESGEKCRVEDISAIRITNNSKETILYADLIYTDGVKELHYYVEMLPVGKSVIVAEKEQQKADNHQLTFVGGEVNYLNSDYESPESVNILPTDLSTIQVKNLTKKTLPAVWIFYRKVDDDGNLLGGRCYSCGVENLGPGQMYEAEAEDWMNRCEVIDVLLLSAEEVNIESWETTDAMEGGILNNQ